METKEVVKGKGVRAAAWRAGASAVAVAALATGCVETDVAQMCPIAGCGQNTPDVDKTPIHGLNLDGLARDGVRLIPRSLVGGGCGSLAGVSLGIVGGELIGVRAGSPVPVCSGDQLIGATFELELGLTRSRTKIAIADRRWVKTWSRRHPEWLPAYLFRPLTARPGWWEGGGRASLCPIAAPWADEPGLVPADDTLALGSADVPVRGARVLDASAVQQYAILVAGELYDWQNATVVPVPPAEQHRWFNLACTGSGLAKMRLLGLDPAIDDPTSRWASTADERQATLKMVTARYCGSRSHTRDGVPIYWSRGRDRNPGALPESVGPIEAVWGPDGATCLSHARVWTDDVIEPEPGAEACACDPLAATPTDCCREREFVEAIRAQCGLPACDAGAGVDRRAWITRTVDHVDRGEP